MKKLDVPFYAQNDNQNWMDRTPGYAQCHITSETMNLMYLKPELVQWSRRNGFKEPESYVRSKYYQYTSMRGNHDAMTLTLERDFGVKSSWNYDGMFSDIKQLIDKEFPVVVGVEYKTAGHIIVVVGYDDKGFWVNDPYGIRSGSSNHYAVINPGLPNLAGKSEYYLNSTFDAIWHNGEGWYREVISVK